MVEDDDVSLLQVETVQVVECVLRLETEGDALVTTKYQVSLLIVGTTWIRRREHARTYVHDIVKHHEGSPSRLLLVPHSYLSNTPIPPEQIVQVFTSNLIVEIFDEQNTVCARWKLGLSGTHGQREMDETHRRIPKERVLTAGRAVAILFDERGGKWW